MSKADPAYSTISVSMVSSAIDTQTRDFDATEILKVIRSGERNIRAQVEAIRKTFRSELATHGDYKRAKKAIDPAKKQLPAVTWSGTFTERTSEKLVNYSGLLCADLDNLGPRLKDVREKLLHSPYVWAMFLSPSGDGLKAVLRVRADASKHRGSFRAVEQHVKELTGVQIDEACKDIARLCFLSYDPQVFHNPNAIEIEPLAEPEKPRSVNGASVDLSVRQRIAGEILGSIDWQSETSGVITCPGKHLHTTGDGVRDCMIDLDQVPTLHCFHNSCRGIVSGVNHEIRSRIDKVEHTDRENRKGETANPTDSWPYLIKDGEICRVRFNEKTGEHIDPLCNFNASVTQDIVIDDGAETMRAFLIEGRLSSGKPLPPVRVPSSKFSSMNWPTESWGLSAVVRAGSGTRDYLREAIQRLSPNPRQRRIYTHTGWREIDGKWIYLSGAATRSDKFEVDLGGELSRYKLPANIDDPIEAMRTSLKLLDLAPLRITAPLWSACFRAPLVSSFPQDLSIWLEGVTGSMKSTLAALFLSHFGDFERIHLPGAWSSTANQMERRAFLLKDSLFVIDDYAPTPLDHRELEARASRLLRSQGNISGRGRLKADLSERPAFAPRGIILSTGEQHPPGQSLSARTLVLELDRADIDMDILTELQNRAGRLRHAMGGYITWLAPQMADMPQLLRETFRGARTKATASNQHLRIPEAAAHLWLGLHCGLSYAQEIGATSAAQAIDLQEKCWQAFLEIGREQGQIVEDEKPARRFLGVLYTIIAQGRAVLLPKDETPTEPKAGVDFVGWRDDDFLYLLPEATFSAVVRFCRDTGEHFPTRQERLKKDLAKDGISECEPKRFTTNLWVDGHTRRVLKLSIPKIKDLIGEDLPTIPMHSHSSHSYEGRRDGL